MTRREKIIHPIDATGLGIEIGPSHRPVAAKRDGFKVHIIDHLDREGLARKYAEHGVDLGAIEEVDFVWRGEPYAELTGHSNFYDWIIASHVIEHTPDLVGFLTDCATVLKPEGILSLAIPDFRYCFDHFRSITPLSRVIDAHESHHRIHSAGSVAEYFLNVATRDGALDWDRLAAGTLKFVHSLHEARQGIRTIREQGIHLDVHAWCFTPTSFRLLIHDLAALGFISFRVHSSFPTQGAEFFVALQRADTPESVDRMSLLREIQRELREMGPE